MPNPTPSRARRSRRRVGAGRWLVLSGSVVVVLLTFRHYGATWDEDIQARYGALVVRYFASGFRDSSCNALSFLRYYGPLVELPPALLPGSTGPARYEIRHLYLALLALLTLPALWRYAHLLRFGVTPVLAAVAVLMLPRFYGHLFANSKDVPFAMAVAWFMYAVAVIAVRRDYRWREMLGGGAAMGLALCIRPGGLPVMLAYLLGALALSDLTRQKARDEGPRPRVVPRLLGMLAIAWLTMILPWPWAHERPITHPLEAMGMASSLPYSLPVLFEGRTMPAADLPWYYLAKYVAITTPPTIAFLACAGLVFMAREQCRAFRGRRSLVCGLTQMWLVVPLVAFSIVRPTVYDGLRHFLFILPALAIMAAFGAAGLLRLARGRHRRWVARVAVLFLLAFPVRDLVRLHPYQMTYFNVLVGGLRGADGRYETDYWIASYREAFAWLRERTAGDSARTPVVLVAGNDLVRPIVEHYAGADFEIRMATDADADAARSEDVDFVVATYRFGLANRLRTDAPVVHQVGRGGAVFTVIREGTTEREH